MKIEIQSFSKNWKIQFEEIDLLPIPTKYYKTFNEYASEIDPQNQTLSQTFTLHYLIRR